MQMHEPSPFREAGITLLLLRTVSLQAPVLPVLYSQLARQLIAAWTDSMCTVPVGGERRKVYPHSLTSNSPKET